MNEDFRIQYKTQTLIDRDNILGQVCRQIANRPALAGAICGLGAVGIAFARASSGAMKAPGIAAILGAIVIVVWVILFVAMRGFFEQQTKVTIDVVRTLAFDGQMLEWTQNKQVVKHFEVQHIELLHAPDERTNKKTQPSAHPVLLKFLGDGETFLLETRLLDEEARLYPKASEEDVQRIDEHLPTHLISPLINQART